MADNEQPVMINLPVSRWGRRLKANEITAVLEFMNRGQLHASEAFPFVQLQARLRELLADEEGDAT